MADPQATAYTVHGALCATRGLAFLDGGFNLPLWKIWKSVGMMKFPIYGECMFQTTNQRWFLDRESVIFREKTWKNHESWKKKRPTVLLMAIAKSWDGHQPEPQWDHHNWVWYGIVSFSAPPNNGCLIQQHGITSTARNGLKFSSICIYIYNIWYIYIYRHRLKSVLDQWRVLRVAAMISGW